MNSVVVLRFILMSLILIAAQVWVLSPVALYRIATPMIYPVLIFLLPVGLGQISLTLIGFAIGSIVDWLGFTPGLHASAFTFVSFLRYYMILPMMDKHTSSDALPTYATFGGGSIFLLAITLLIHHIILYALDAGHQFELLSLFIRFSSGWFSSFILCLLILLMLGTRIYPRANRHGQ